MCNIGESICFVQELTASYQRQREDCKGESENHLHYSRFNPKCPVLFCWFHIIVIFLQLTSDPESSSCVYVTRCVYACVCAHMYKCDSVHVCC